MEAREYLIKEMDGSLLYADQELVQELIRLNWRLVEWDAAEKASERFNESIDMENGRELAYIWRSLTRAARAFAQDNIELAQAELGELDKRSLSDSGRKMVKDEGEQLTQDALNRLLKEAEFAAASRKDEDLVQAAEKFYLATKIEPYNHRAELGLSQLGEKLAPIAGQLCEKARSQKLGQLSLAEVVSKARGLLASVEAICAVAEALQLDADLTARLESTREQLGSKKSAWEMVENKLGLYDASLSEALSQPRAFGRDGSGGWVFDLARGHLTDATRHVSQGEVRRIFSDNDLRTMLYEHESRLKNHEDSASQLHYTIKALLDAIAKEDFAVVREKARGLDHYWTDLRKLEPRWGGLERLIEYSYLHGKAAKPIEHLILAEQQERNYEAWKNWAAQVLQSYSRLNQPRRLLHSPLDNQKRLHSLKWIIAECENGISACTEFERAWNQKPAQSPLSDKARQEAEKITAEQVTEVIGSINQNSEDFDSPDQPAPGLHTRFSTMRETALKELVEFERVGRGELWMLKKTMETLRKLRNENAFRNAERKLEEAARIDPNHEEIIRIRQELDKLQRR
jgi:hypothetical protein